MLELRHRCRSFVQTRSAVGDRCVRLSDSAAEALVQQSRRPERKWGQVITVDDGRELQSLHSPIALQLEQAPQSACSDDFPRTSGFILEAATLQELRI